MNTIVPLISSGVAGPLGVLHLPRLWLKVSLEQRGKLAAGYPGIGKGYDQMVLDGIGLQKDAVVLPKATSTEHIKQNAELDFEIADADMRVLDAMRDTEEHEDARKVRWS